MTSGKFKGTESFAHNHESLKKFWKVVGQEAGVELEVGTKWGPWEDYGYEPKRCERVAPGMGVLEFTVRLL